MSNVAPVTQPTASLLAGCTTSRSWAEQDEAPFHREASPSRRAITEDRQGVPLSLGIRLVADTGAPVRDATVDIWHCDALGRYSGFPPPDDSVVVSADDAPRAAYLPDQTFLRGRQRTDMTGMVEFHTIYPGWYPGRTVHVHLMVHAGDTTLTSQLYFPEDINGIALSSMPYAERPGRDTTNRGDEIFPTGGAPAVLDVIPADPSCRAGICLVLPP